MLSIPQPPELHAHVDRIATGVAISEQTAAVAVATNELNSATGRRGLSPCEGEDLGRGIRSYPARDPPSALWIASTPIATAPRFPVRNVDLRVCVRGCRSCAWHSGRFLPIALALLLLRGDDADRLQYGDRPSAATRGVEGLDFEFASSTRRHRSLISSESQPRSPSAHAESEHPPPARGVAAANAHRGAPEGLSCSADAALRVLAHPAAYEGARAHGLASTGMGRRPASAVMKAAASTLAWSRSSNYVESRSQPPSKASRGRLRRYRVGAASALSGPQFMRPVAWRARPRRHF